MANFICIKDRQNESMSTYVNPQAIQYIIARGLEISLYFGVNDYIKIECQDESELTNALLKLKAV